LQRVLEPLREAVGTKIPNLLDQSVAQFALSQVLALTFANSNQWGHTARLATIYDTATDRVYIFPEGS
jgi:hypothetical protein